MALAHIVKGMGKNSKITIIDTEELRGVLAPSGILSKKTLTDMLDFIELSSDAAAGESEARIQEADKHKSWLSLNEVRRAAEEKN